MSPTASRGGGWTACSSARPMTRARFMRCPPARSSSTTRRKASASSAPMTARRSSSTRPRCPPATVCKRARASSSASPTASAAPRPSPCACSRPRRASPRCNRKPADDMAVIVEDLVKLLDGIGGDLRRGRYPEKRGAHGRRGAAQGRGRARCLRLPNPSSRLRPSVPNRPRRNPTRSRRRDRARATATTTASDETAAPGSRSRPSWPTRCCSRRSTWRGARCST